MSVLRYGPETFTVGSNQNLNTFDANWVLDSDPSNPMTAMVIDAATDTIRFPGGGANGTGHTWRGSGTPTGDQKILIDIYSGASGDGPFAGLVLRSGGSTENRYLIEVDIPSAEWVLYRVTSGPTYTIIDTGGTVAQNTLYNCTGKAIGTNPVVITLDEQINGAGVINFSDSNAARKTSGWVGISAYQSSGTSSLYLDNISIYDESASGQTVTVNQVTETDTAQALGAKRKLKALNQNTETDLAQAMARVKRKTLGQPSETDLAQPMAWAPKRRLVNFITEADLAQPLGAKRKQKAIGQNTETDLAQPITRAAPGSQIIPIGQATEVDLAQTLALIRKLKAVGQLSETDVAQAITRNKRRTLGLTSETDSATALAKVLKRTLIGLNEETDLARTITVIGGEGSGGGGGSGPIFINMGGFI